MDTYEATKTVLSRVKSLDPENASRITGYILIQDQGEQEMIRLAFSPESVLVSYVNQAKACLGISSNTCSTPSTPSSPSPFGNTSTLNRANPFSQASPRIIIPNTRFHLNNNPSSPSSPWSRCSSRSAASYAAVVNNGSTNTASGSSSSSLSLPFYGNNNNNNSGSGDLSDEIGNIPVQDQLSFLDESALSPSGRSDSMVFPYGNCEENTVLHRRSCSVNDAFLGGGGGGEDGGNMGLGWRPCLYYSRGFCKNGNTCKFLHHGGEFGVAAGDIPPDCGVAAGPRVGPGSPSNIDGFDELLKLKALQQQRFAQQLMASGAPPPPFAYNKCMNFLTDGQRSAATALMMGDEFNKFGRYRPCRSDFQNLGLGGSDSSASRQIYLTFPADSTFKEEDVSNYFSIYGPVQDVRIPYQQKRMFGFVTFVHSETVKLILAKGNPHFVCDSRVLVKPYKEKGKVPDKKQQYHQHLERGDFSGCLSPTGLDSRELYDLPFGARMFYNNQEMMLRRKLEQEVELKQAMEIQGRRLMNLQLMDLKTQHHHMFPGVPSPRHPHSPFNQNHFFPQDCINLDVPGDTNGDMEATIFSNAASNEQVSEKSNGDPENVDNSDNKQEGSNVEDPDPNESLENILPDHLFASPTKSADDATKTMVSSNFKQMLPNNSNLGMTSLKSNCFEIPRFSSGQEAAEI